MNLRSEILALPLVVGLSLPGAVTLGETFLLGSGGSLDGRLVNPDESPREKYVIRLESGGTVTLERSQVTQVTREADEIAWYRQWLPKVPQTVEGHWTMAEECRQRSLKDQRAYHLQEILKLDPEHEAARYGLGYSRVDGKWVKTDEWNRAQGYVRYRGSWRIPQDVALEQAAEATEKKVKGWKQRLKTLRTWVERPRGREREALDEIRSIQEPTAVPGLAELAKDTTAPRDLRLLAIDVMSRQPSYLVVPVFVDRVMKDPEAAIRDASLDALARIDSPQSVRLLLRYLDSKDNVEVNRAGICLGALRAEDAALPLINALVTEHRFRIETSSGGPGQYNAGFGNTGGNSFSAGGRPKIVTQSLRNEGVLNALVAIFPNTNFGYDIEGWKAWFVDQHRAVDVDLRREL